MKWTHYLAVIVLFLSVSGLIFTSWPLPVSTTEIPLIINDRSQGTLVLSMPGFLRLGDKSKIGLIVEFSPDNSDNDSDAQLQLKDRLELGAVQVSPKGEGRTRINANSKAVFVWEVRSYIPGKYSGLVWLFEESPAGEDSLILGRSFQMETRSFLGLRYPLARWGFIGFTIIGLILVLPALLRRQRS